MHLQGEAALYPKSENPGLQSSVIVL
jgi:hypothetical protein